MPYDNTKLIDTKADSKIISSAFHVEIPNPVYVRLTSSDISSFQISLLDLNLKSAKLMRGRSTVVKLLVREVKSENKMPSIAITVSSKVQKYHTDNVHSKFSVDLAYTIILPGDGWKICLVSCSIPTRYELPFDPRDRTVQLKIYSNDPMSDYVSRQSVTFPNSLHSTEEIAGHLNKVLTQAQGHFSKDEQTGNLMVDSKKQMEILVRAKFAYFLGATPQTLNESII